MTLESRISKNVFIGNGSTVEFPFSFRVWSPEQVQVFVGGASGDVDATQECEISASPTGGSVTFAAPPGDGVPIVIRRKMPYIQQDQYLPGTRFNAHEVEDRFDQDCAERQDLRLDVDRAVKVPVTDSRTPEEFTAAMFTAIGAAENIASIANSAIADVEAYVSRAENIADMGILTQGRGCAEETWTLEEDSPAGTVVELPAGLWYIVGRYHLRLFYDGLQLDHTRWLEVGTLGSISTRFKLLVSLPAGTEITAWIVHLHSAGGDGGEASGDAVPYAEAAGTDALGNDISETYATLTGVAADLEDYAPLASPALSGVPTAPQAAAGTNTTQIATCSYVQGEIAALSETVPETLAALQSLAEEIGESQTVADALTAAVGAKLDVSSANYIKSLSKSGHVVTATLGSNATQTLNFQSVCYTTNLTTVPSGLPAGSVIFYKT